MNSRTAFKQTAQTVRVKLNGARALLGTAGVYPDEAAPLLLSGWQQLARAIAADGAAAGSYRQVVAVARGAGGALAPLPPHIFEDFDRIETAVRRRDGSTPSDLPAHHWHDAVDHLQQALGCLHRWHGQVKGGRLRKMVRYAALVVVVLGGLGLTGTIATGFYLASRVPNADEGLTATYFTGPRFAGHPFRRIDHQLAYRWHQRPPLLGLKRHQFSVRLEGCLVIDEASPNMLVAESDFPLRIHIDDQLYANHHLSPGIHTIRVEISDAKLPGAAAVSWVRQAGDRPTPIPAAQLVPSGGNRRHACPAVAPPTAFEAQER